MDNFDKTVTQYLSFLDNEYVSAALSLLLVVYAGMAAPALPPQLAALFDNMFFKLLVFFLIVYSSRRNPTVAIIAAVGLMISLQTLARYKSNMQMMALMQEARSRVAGTAGGVMGGASALVSGAQGMGQQVTRAVGGLVEGGTTGLSQLAQMGASVGEGVVGDSMAMGENLVGEGMAMGERAMGEGMAMGESMGEMAGYFGEGNGEMVGEEQGSPSCAIRDNYRNNFYPQYVNAAGQHAARLEQDEVMGYETSNNYAPP